MARKKNTALIPYGKEGQVIEVPWQQVHDRDMTIEAIRLLGNPIFATVAAITGAELLQKVGLLSDNWASVIQGTVTAMGVASVMDKGGLAGSGLLTGAIAGTAGVGVASALNEGWFHDIIWGVAGGAYPGEGLYKLLTGK